MKMKKKSLNFKNFSPISKFVKSFKLKDFNNEKKVRNYLKFFELKTLLSEIKEDKIKSNTKKHLVAVDKKEIKPFKPDLNDLCRLHWLVLARRAINTLEFGNGISTLFIADAKSILANYFKRVPNLRFEKFFHIYSVGESKFYINLTKKRFNKHLKKHVNFTHSKIEIINYDGKYALKHQKIPNISPDLIYLDGPSINSVKNKKFENFRFDKICRVPIASDILSLEFFLEPGTFIIIDGRSANAEFLRYHLKRKWKYFFDQKSDCHYFLLNEKPWGYLNKARLNFCLKDKIKFF